MRWNTSGGLKSCISTQEPEFMPFLNYASAKKWLCQSHVTPAHPRALKRRLMGFQPNISELELTPANLKS